MEYSCEEAEKVCRCLWRTICHIESLKNMLEKLDNIKKPIGDPSSQPGVRCTKHIARGILNKEIVETVGSLDKEVIRAKKTETAVVSMA